MYKQGGMIHFDIYYKPTNAFSYLRYNSSHPKHTIDNIALSLGKRIVRIVSENRETRLDELRSRLINRDHPPKVIDTALLKLFQPQTEKKEENITFVHTYNPGLRYNRDQLKYCLKQSNHHKILEVFGDTDVILATRQPANLRKMLTKAKFDLIPEVKYRPPPGLYPCGNCTYCDRGYIRQMDNFRVVGENLYVSTWTFTRHFTCIVKMYCMYAKPWLMTTFTLVKQKMSNNGPQNIYLMFTTQGIQCAKNLLSMLEMFQIWWNHFSCTSHFTMLKKRIYVISWRRDLLDDSDQH